VLVPITPAAVNRPPVFGETIVGTADPITGVVRGRVSATDPDGDALTFNVHTPPHSGTATVDQQGNFTYTPTAAARVLAGTTPGYQNDGFMITALDGGELLPAEAVLVPITPYLVWG
jgi:VCBS repeat-containing protein